MGEHKLFFAAKALHVPWNDLILKRSVYCLKDSPSIMSMLKMSYLSDMGAKHVAWCSPVEESPRSGHMAHELWHDMLCFMGVCHDLLLRIWYPCLIFEWYACLWLKCDMARLLHVKRAFFWYNCLNLKILLCHMLVFSYITCGNALTMLWFLCVIFVSFLAFDTRFGLYEKLM
jgi:hypothetical protein